MEEAKKPLFVEARLTIYTCPPLASIYKDSQQIGLEPEGIISNDECQEEVLFKTRCNYHVAC